MADDAALLDAWRRTRCEAAFAALVDRHAGMVHATCRRLLGRGHPLLDDACQAVFVQLARRPEVVRDPHALAGWLHYAAIGVVRNVRRGERRRRVREQTSPLAPAPAPAPAAEPELAALLDHAIARLTPVQREAVVRHFLQDKPQAVVAQELGVSEGAVKKRVADAIAKLRDQLARRGVAVGGAALAALAGGGCAGSSAPIIAPRAGALRPGGAGPSVEALARAGHAAWWQHAALAVIAASLAIAAVVGLAPEAEAPPPVAAPAAPATPEIAAVRASFLDPLEALRRNDLPGFFALLSATNRRVVEGAWRRERANSVPAFNAFVDLGLRFALAPGAADVIALGPPAPLLVPAALDEVAALLEATQPAAAACVREVQRDCLRWLETADIDGWERRRASAASYIAAVRAWDVRSMADVDRLEFAEFVARFSGVFRHFKAWFTPFGLDLDGVLASCAVDAIAGDGDERTIVVRFTAFARSHACPLVVRRRGGRWSCDGLQEALGAAFVPLSRAFFVPEPTSAPRPRRSGPARCADRPVEEPTPRPVPQ